MSSGANRSRTSSAWSLPPDPELEARRRETRPLDFLAFASFGFPSVILHGLPLDELACTALVALSFGRPGTSKRPVPTWFTALLGALWLALAASSYLNGLTPMKRLLHLGLYAVLAIFLASGRIHVPSAVKGLACGMFVAVVASAAGFGPDNYPGRLTGYLADPNKAGFYITVFGSVALGLTSRKARPSLWWAFAVAMAAGTVLTFSRTSLLAMVFVVAWVLIGRRLGKVLGFALVGAMVYLVGHIPQSLLHSGAFADRVGSDELRARIEILERAAVAVHPLYGNGAGTATVTLPNGVGTFFFHSSYLGLRAEGGWISMSIFVALVVAVFLALIRLPRESRNGWLEAALIALMVCAVNLGEVLLELGAAVTLGLLMWRYLNVDRAPAERTVPRPTFAARGAAPRRASGSGSAA